VRARWLLLAATALLLAPGAAQAHLVATGMGPLYDGVTHFALSPEDGLPVAALALYAGLRGPAHARLSLTALPLAWFAGGLLASATGASLPPVALGVVSAAIMLGLGGLLAANLDLSSRFCAGLALVLGLARGAADMAGAAFSGGAVLTLVGMCAAVFVLFALAASITLPLRRFWMIVAARVTGSWLAATGLLLAGWIIRYGARVQ
jgi:urease accessory protein